MSDLLSRSELIKELMEQIPLAENVHIFRDIIESQPTVREKEIRNKVIEEALEKSAEAICVGCAYLNGHECTYNGANCGVSKPMLETVTKALEQMKEVGE